MEKHIKNILNELNIKPNWLGYKMWVTAVNLRLECDYSKMELIYFDIAKKHKSTTKKVEKAMRYVIDMTKREKIGKYFRVNYRITNSTFLELLYEKVLIIVEQEKMSKCL